MSIPIEQFIIDKTGAQRCRSEAVIQELWSGYGSIRRYLLEGADRATLIAKHISPPKKATHPRGWSSPLSHQRKLKSYQVESVWYQKYASLSDQKCRVPECLSVTQYNEEVVILLEDLCSTGYSEKRTVVSQYALEACLLWLAEFHATFMGHSAEGLWESGTYWHLETRPDELERLAKEDQALYESAYEIDSKLKSSSYQTLVHGDAKLANFCFTPDDRSVSAVDFQYVGGGCGMRDVAYFIGSCFGEEECERQSPALLDYYFCALRQAIMERNVAVDREALEADWRELYPFAWTDFHRFLKGWHPGHWKIHSYSERLSQNVIAQIQKERSEF